MSAVEITAFTTSAIGKISAGASIVSSRVNKDGTNLFTLASDGRVSSTWTTSGSVKNSFGEGGSIDTKTQFCTCIEVYADDFGSGSLLTGGGYELGSSGRPDQVMSTVKQWDVNSGLNVATYMAGSGLVRCIGIPGVTQDNVATTIPLDGGIVYEEGKYAEEEKVAAAAADDDPYADDPTFNIVSEETGKKIKDKKIKDKRVNGHRLNTFVSGGDDIFLRIWDCNKKTLVAELFEEGIGAMKNVATCEGRQGLVVSGHRAGPECSHGSVCIWDVNGRTCMKKIEEVHTSEVSAMALSACGNTLYTAGGADDPSMKEWDLRMMKKVKNVGFHEDRILNLGLLTKPNSSSYLFSASKDGIVGLTSISSSGVVRSKLLAEFSDFKVTGDKSCRSHLVLTFALLQQRAQADNMQTLLLTIFCFYFIRNAPHIVSISSSLQQGLNNSISLAPMKLGGVSYAGGQKRKARPDVYTVSADKYLRLYDLQDCISLNATAIDSSGAEGVQKDASKISSRSAAEDNYHAKQLEFWENFPTSEEVQRSRSGRAEEKKAASAQSIDEVKRDKYGNEFGSIEYWIAKGNEPKRPKVGDIVVLAGDNAVTESDPSLGEITPEQKAALEAMQKDKSDRLSEDAKLKALKFNKADLGIIVSDDKSGVPFEILSGLNGEKSWYEEDQIEVANIETIKRAKRQNNISVANLKLGDVKKQGDDKLFVEQKMAQQQGVADDDLNDDEAHYYQVMMNGHGGYGMNAEAKHGTHPSGRSPVTTESKGRGAEVKPPSPPPPSKADVAADFERQRAVEQSMAIYKKKKKERRGGRF